MGLAKADIMAVLAKRPKKESDPGHDLVAELKEALKGDDHGHTMSIMRDLIKHCSQEEPDAKTAEEKA